MGDLLSILPTLALAGFGALVRYAQKFTGKKDERPEWEWRVVAINIVIGAFAGLLTLWIVQKKFEADYVHVFVALAGYGGPLTIDAVWDAGRDTLRRMLGSSEGAKNDGPKS